MVSIKDFKTEEDKLKALNFYVDAIKKQKYGTYKKIAKRFGISERQLRRLRRGDSKMNMRILKSVKKSFESSKKYNWFVVVITGQSAAATGNVIEVMTENAALKTLERVENSQATEMVYYHNIFRPRTKRGFKMTDYENIINVCEEITQNDMIFFDEIGFLEDCIKLLPTNEKSEAEEMLYEIDF